jgi:hypothetical protein
VKKYKRTIAPRLQSKEVRDNIGHCLVPEIKEALKIIAQTDRKSVSYLLELAIVDYFGLKRPRYLKRKSE